MMGFIILIIAVVFHIVALNKDYSLKDRVEALEKKVKELEGKK